MNTFYKTRIRLLDPEGGEGGGAATAVEAPVANLPTGTRDQMDTFKGSPTVPFSTKATALPAEIKGKVFDISDEADIDYGSNPDAASSGDFKAEKPEKKVEQKQEEKKVEIKQEEQKPGLKAGLPTITQPVQKTNPEARDYSIFPEDKREHLKKMSNEAFNYFKEVYTEHKKTQEEFSKIKPEYEKLQNGGLPSQWYTHPEAWRLHPTAQSELTKVQRLEFEESFWAKQLEAINNGEQFQMLRGYDKQGNPVYSDPIEPSQKAANDTLLLLGRYQSEKQRAYVGINTFASTFKQQMAQQEAVIEGFIAEQWPWHKDENHPAQKWVKEFESVVPPERKGDYMSRVASCLYASLQEANKLLAEKQQQETLKETVKETVKHVEPRAQTPSPSKAGSAGGKFKGVPATFSLDGLE